MRIFYLLFIFFIHLGNFAQNIANLPLSGMYNDTVVINNVPNHTIYYTSQGHADSESLKRLKDSLIITKTTTLLLRVKNDTLDTLIQRSYHIGYDSKLAILSITIDPEDLWNDTTGIYTKGKYAYFNDSTEHWENCNYQKNWEKNIYTTFIDTNNVVGFSQQAGIKIFGESTRRQPDKSMKIIARKKYGKKKFKYRIFPEKDIKKYKQLVIRASGNDYAGSRFKDAMSAHLARNLGLDYMAWRPINLFINGEYWGVYNLREKINDHYIAANHDVKKDSVNITMGRWITQQGSGKAYKKMYYWFADLDTMDNKAYEKAKQFINVRNYINYRVFQIYINNKDSRGNIRYYNINGEKDQRFKMILYDTDLGYGKYSMNYLEKCLSPTPTEWYNPVWSTMYLTKLMQHPEFKNEFATQFAHIMNTSLHKDTMLAAVDKFEAIYINELPRSSSGRPSHLKKTYFPLERWQDDVNSLRSYAKLRPKVMWKHLQSSLELDDTFVLILKGDSGMVSINDNYPIHLPYAGLYFKNIPLTIKIIPDSNFVFDYWEGGDSIATQTVNNEQDSVVLLPNFIKVIPKVITPVNEPITEMKKEVIPTHANQDWLYFIAYAMLGLSCILFLLYFTWTKKV
jgi:hypothetical protein